MSSSIIRVIHRRQYAIVDRQMADDPRLSMKSKGLLLYLLAKPDNWQVNVSDILNHCTDGEYAIRAAMKELMSTGYMTHQVIRDLKGLIVKHEYTVYETGEINPQYQDKVKDASGDINVQYPYRGHPHVGYPDVDNRDVNNNDINLITNQLNNDSIPADAGQGDPPAVEQPPEYLQAVDTFRKKFGVRWLSPGMCQAIEEMVSSYGVGRVNGTITWASEARIPSSRAIKAIRTSLSKSPEGKRHERKTTAAREDIDSLETIGGEYGETEIEIGISARI